MRKGHEGASGRSGPELAQLPRGFCVAFADSGREPAGLRFPNDQVRLVGPCAACWGGLPVQGEGRGLAAAEGTQATAENDGGAAGQHPTG